MSRQPDVHRRLWAAAEAGLDLERLATGAARTYIVRVIRIAISQAAFDIAESLPGNVGYENERAPNGDVYVWLAHDVLAKLKALRSPGEDYSTVILRLAEATAGR
jgi:hypothetical protein